MVMESVLLPNKLGEDTEKKRDVPVAARTGPKKAGYIESDTNLPESGSAQNSSNH